MYDAFRAKKLAEQRALDAADQEIIAKALEDGVELSLIHI